jgi:hypothetical protein
MDCKRTARVLIADNHKFVADACKQMLNGLGAGAQIKRNLPSLKLVFLAASSDGVAAEAFRLGASS